MDKIKKPCITGNRKDILPDYVLTNKELETVETQREVDFFFRTELENEEF